MLDEEMKSFLAGQAGLSEFRVDEIRKGGSNDNFLVSSKKRKYVLRQSRSDVPTEDRLQNEYIVYNFLEEQGVENVPRSVAYDREMALHLITYVPGEDVKVGDLSQQEIGNLASIMADYSNQSFGSYKKFCKKHSFSPREPPSPMEDFEKYGISRFEDIDRDRVSAELIDGWRKG